MKEHVKAELMRFFPAGAGAGYSAWTLNQWVAAATLAYVIFQFLYLGRKWWREERAWKLANPGRKRGQIIDETSEDYAQT